MDKVNLLWQEGLDLRISLTRQILRSADGGIDALHDILQESQRTVFPVNHSLPVPLVHIQRVQVIQLLVRAYRVHICIDAIARLYLILCQRESLPLGQRVHHLSLGIAQILDGEGDGTFHTIQVVVDTKSFQHEQGSRHTSQSQLCREVLLEEILNQFDTLLRLLGVKQRFIHHRFNYLSHIIVYDSFAAAKVHIYY